MNQTAPGRERRRKRPRQARGRPDRDAVPESDTSAKRSTRELTQPPAVAAPSLKQANTETRVVEPPRAKNPLAAAGPASSTSARPRSALPRAISIRVARWRRMGFAALIVFGVVSWGLYSLGLVIVHQAGFWICFGVTGVLLLSWFLAARRRRILQREADELLEDLPEPLEAGKGRRPFA